VLPIPVSGSNPPLRTKAWSGCISDADWFHLCHSGACVDVEYKATAGSQRLMNIVEGTLQLRRFDQVFTLSNAQTAASTPSWLRMA